MEQYLKAHYHDEIIDLLNDSNDRTHAYLQVDLGQLQQQNFNWFEAILNKVYVELPKWDAALLAAQKTIATDQEAFLEDGYQIKVNCHVRFVHLPPPDPRYKLPFPNHDQIGMFRDVKGTVVRMSQVKLLEIKREFICSKCHVTIEVEADYSLMYRFDVPKCTKVECKGTMHQKSLEPLPQYCVNYQELKIQEALSEKNIPPTLVVTLESDLVDSCQPGDCVTICGTIERRWISFQYEGKCEAVLAMRAVSLTREQNSLTINSNDMSEQMITLKMDWMEHLSRHGELGMRDIILKSICPDVYGMYPVKLAIVLAICSGNEISDNRLSDGSQQRGQSHVLMVGDPGLAKSKLLLSAVTIAPRAVHTTGMGCSTAGLTAAAVKEDGEWQLEAGALVLADGGICCIDEFNLMRETDRTSIHEAMEQQTISMAKAGIVCKLNTRCAILAAANPKNLHAMSEPESTSSVNIGIATPLLSRFDLVFILRDERIPEWDEAISDHLLAQVTTGYTALCLSRDSDIWSTHKLQMHFAAISQVQPKLTPIASAILSAYYRKCRSDPERDQGRTTIRLLDSLNRLAEAHARLVFREEVNAIDAIVTIRLMESTFGFGRIVKPYDVIKEELPLGPDDEEIKCILNIFDMDASTLIEDTEKNSHLSQTKSAENLPQINEEKHSDNEQPTNDQNLSEQSQQAPTSGTQNFNRQNAPATQGIAISLKSQSPALSQPKPSQVQSQQSSHLPLQSQGSLTPSLRPVINMDMDELDELLSFDDAPVNTNKGSTEKDSTSQTPTPVQTVISQSQSQNEFSDDEDMALSQALDDIERSQKISSTPIATEMELDTEQTNLLLLNEEQHATTTVKSNRPQIEDDSALDTLSFDENEFPLSVGEPAPKIQKIDQNRTNRLQLKLGPFAFVAPKKPNKENSMPTCKSNQDTCDKNEPSNSEKVQPVHRPVKNRIMCTPSDDENSQTEPSANRKPPNRPQIQLNWFKNSQYSQQSNKSQALQQQDVVAATKIDESKSENDSAYDTMSFSSNKSLSNSALHEKTGKTPALFPPSGPIQNPNNDEDLSFLDTLEF